MYAGIEVIYLWNNSHESKYHCFKDAQINALNKQGFLSFFFFFPPSVTEKNSPIELLVLAGIKKDPPHKGPCLFQGFIIGRMENLQHLVISHLNMSSVQSQWRKKKKKVFFQEPLRRDLPRLCKKQNICQHSLLLFFIYPMDIKKTCKLVGAGQGAAKPFSWLTLMDN